VHPNYFLAHFTLCIDGLPITVLTTLGTPGVARDTLIIFIVH